MRTATTMMMATLAVTLMGCGESAADDPDNEYAAEDVCQQFVEDRLKSPATADFSNESATKNATSWTITGDVDSENSFGALVRTTYVCEVSHTTGDSWRLVDLQTSER